MDLDDAPPSGVILYVEDDPVNFLLVEQALSQWPGVRVVWAKTGAEGIDLVRTLVPDLLILDMHLPDMTGLELFRALEGELEEQRTEVAILSASALPDEINAARAAGLTRYWTKPLNIHQFREAVRGLLR